MSEDCEFNQLRDSLIKDMIIIGIKDKKLQERLLRENDINLEKVLSNCRASEASKLQTESIHNRVDPPSQSINQDVSQINHRKGSKEIVKQCKFCAGSHPRGACPAYGKTCNTCQNKGHFSSCCTKSSPRSNQSNKNKSKSHRRPPRKPVHTVASSQPPALTSDSDNSDADNEFFMGSIEVELPTTEPTQSSPEVSAIEVETPAEIDQISDPTATKHQDWLIDLETNARYVYHIQNRYRSQSQCTPNVYF